MSEQESSASGCSSKAGGKLEHLHTSVLENSDRKELWEESRRKEKRGDQGTAMMGRSG